MITSSMFDNKATEMTGTHYAICIINSAGNWP